MSEKDEVLIEQVRGLEKADAGNTALILNENRRLSEPLTDDEARRRMSGHCVLAAHRLHRRICIRRGFCSHRPRHL